MEVVPGGAGNCDPNEKGTRLCKVSVKMLFI